MNGAELLEKLGRPNPLWQKEIPASERVSRQELIRVADLYFEGLENNDGKGEYPFADHCNRLENGMQTTNNPNAMPPGNNPPPPGEEPFNFAALNCKEQFETGFYRIVTCIRERRYLVVDQERGVVFSYVFFDHKGALNEYTLTNGRKIQSNLTPWTWMIGEAFKIEKGVFTFIEAVMIQVPYGMKSGW